MNPPTPSSRNMICSICQKPILLEEQLDRSTSSVQHLACAKQYGDYFPSSERDQLRVELSEQTRLMVEAGNEMVKANQERDTLQSQLSQREVQLKKATEQNETLRKQVEETTKSYETVKAWAHRLEGTLATIIKRCDDHADGAPDSTALGKFANELIGLSNEITLGNVRTIQQERDTALAQLKEANSKLALQNTGDWIMKRLIKLENLESELSTLRKDKDRFRLEEKPCGDIWLHVKNGDKECQASINLGQHRTNQGNTIVGKALRTAIQGTK